MSRRRRHAPKPEPAPPAEPTLAAIEERERREAAIGGPTPERLLRGPVDIASQPTNGARHYPMPARAVDTLGAMEAAGTITAAEAGAGERFMRDFALAHLEAMQAASLDRTATGAHELGNGFVPGNEAARRRVRDKIWMVGGPKSSGGSCLWHILGEQMSLRQWAAERIVAGRRISQHEASGILRTVLGVLATRRD